GSVLRCAGWGRRVFLGTVRDLVASGEVKPQPPPAAPVPVAAISDPMQTLVQAGIQFLEALAAVLSANGTKANGTAPAPSSPLPPLVATDTQTGRPVLQLPLPPPEVLQRGAAALQTIVKRVVDPEKSSASELLLLF